MFEEDFIIRTLREGTVQTDQAIEAIVTQMGTTLMTDRSLGTVVIVAEMVNGQITKQNIRWAQGNDPAFDKALDPMAKKLLPEVVRVVQGGGGGNGDLKVKVVAKK